MGTRGYDDDWDSLDVWSHIGYPGDLNSGERPVFVGDFSEWTAATPPSRR